MDPFSNRFDEPILPSLSGSEAGRAYRAAEESNMADYRRRHAPVAWEDQSSVLNSIPAAYRRDNTDNTAADLVLSLSQQERNAQFARTASLLTPNYNSPLPQLLPGSAPLLSPGGRVPPPTPGGRRPPHTPGGGFDLPLTQRSILASPNDARWAAVQPEPLSNSQLSADSYPGSRRQQGGTPVISSGLSPSMRAAGEGGGRAHQPVATSRRAREARAASAAAAALRDAQSEQQHQQALQLQLRQGQEQMERQEALARQEAQRRAAAASGASAAAAAAAAFNRPEEAAAPAASASAAEAAAPAAFNRFAWSVQPRAPMAVPVAAVPVVEQLASANAIKTFSDLLSDCMRPDKQAEMAFAVEMFSQMVKSTRDITEVMKTIQKNSADRAQKQFRKRRNAAVNAVEPGPAAAAAGGAAAAEGRQPDPKRAKKTSSPELDRLIELVDTYGETWAGTFDGEQWRDLLRDFDRRSYLDTVVWDAKQPEHFRTAYAEIGGRIERHVAMPGRSDYVSEETRAERLQDLGTAMYGDLISWDDRYSNFPGTKKSKLVAEVVADTEHYPALFFAFLDSNWHNLRAHLETLTHLSSELTALKRHRDPAQRALADAAAPANAAAVAVNVIAVERRENAGRDPPPL